MKYGSYIWMFIPLLWWHWWISDAQELYGNITVDNPSSVLIDRANDIQYWN